MPLGANQTHSALVVGAHWARDNTAAEKGIQVAIPEMKRGLAVGLLSKVFGTFPGPVPWGTAPVCVESRPEPVALAAGLRRPYPAAAFAAAVAGGAVAFLARVSVAIPIWFVVPADAGQSDSASARSAAVLFRTAAAELVHVPPVGNQEGTSPDLM